MLSGVARQMLAMNAVAELGRDRQRRKHRRQDRNIPPEKTDQSPEVEQLPPERALSDIDVLQILPSRPVTVRRA